MKTAIKNGKIVSYNNVISVQENQSLIIENNIIADIVENSQVEKKYPDAKIIDATNKAILSGFANCHTHFRLTLARGIFENESPSNTPPIPGLPRRALPEISKEEHQIMVLLGAIESIKAGTTAAMEVAEGITDYADELQKSGLRLVLAEQISDRISGSYGEPGEIKSDPQKNENGLDLLSLGQNSSMMREIRGGQISMVFQEPMVSFSPVHTIGDQITEAILLHSDVTKQEARIQVIDLLEKVGIPNAEQRIDEYSFRLSGGMRQRAMIALALACNPGLLIADEPTTALDVTTQAQILQLMKDLQVEFGMGMMLITHNLGVVAQMADKIIVMYLGKIVKMADTKTLFNDPKHPYTQELLRSIPKLSRERSTERLNAISGSVPPPFARPGGCTFHPRCPQAMMGKCDVVEPTQMELEDGRIVSCLLYEEN